MKALTQLSKSFAMVTSSVVALSLITPTMPTWAASSPTQVEGETLAAQVSITRDMLSRMLSQLQSETENRVNGGSHPDFLAKSREFNARVAQAMELFERKMAEGPLKQAGIWVDRIRQIQKSEIYTSEQKEALVADQMRQAKKHFQLLSADYQQLLRELYFVAAPNFKLEVAGLEIERSHEFEPFAPFKMSMNIVPGRTKSATARFRIVMNDPILGSQQSEFAVDWDTLMAREDGRDVSWEDRAFSIDNTTKSIDNAKAKLARFLPYGAFPVRLMAPVKAAFSDKVIRLGCYTSSCLALFSSQLSSFVTLVKSSLDKPIEFVMTPNGVRPPLKERRWSSDDDGRAAIEAVILRLVPLELDSKSLSAFYDIDRSLDTGLPFQLTDGEYRQAWQVNLNGLLIEKSADFKAGCPIQVTQLARFACRSEAGCMNESERSVLSSAIEAADLSRTERARRQACLKVVKP